MSLYHRSSQHPRPASPGGPDPSSFAPVAAAEAPLGALEARGFVRARVRAPDGTARWFVTDIGEGWKVVAQNAEGVELMAWLVTHGSFSVVKL